MSAIVAAKDALQTLVVAAGVPAERVARNLASEDELVSLGVMPLVGLITADARFIDATEQGIRAVRRLPVEVHIVAETETEGTALLDQILTAMPDGIRHDGRDVAMELTSELHSDHIADVTTYYMCVVVVTFDFPIGG